jgi:hypothetical protein
MKIAFLLKILYFFSWKKNLKEDVEANEEKNEKKLICRFVFDGSGNKIGESIALDEDIIIIKKKSEYLGVPIKHIEENGNVLLVKGLIDRDKSIELGEKWRKNCYNLIDKS